MDVVERSMEGGREGRVGGRHKAEGEASEGGGAWGGWELAENVEALRLLKGGKILLP